MYKYINKLNTNIEKLMNNYKVVILTDKHNNNNNHSGHTHHHHHHHKLKNIKNGSTNPYYELLKRIWDKIKKDLEDKGYSFQEYTIDVNEHDIYDIVHMVENNKYDLAIGPFIMNEYISTNIVHTTPFLFTSDVIIYEEEHSIMGGWLHVLSVFTKPFLMLITISIVLGLLLYWIDPHRYRKIKIPKYHSYRRSFVTALSSLMGEFGFLSENTGYSFSQITLMFFIMVIGFVFVLYIQALVVHEVVEIEKEQSFNYDNLKNKHIASLIQNKHHTQHKYKFGDLSAINANDEKLYEYIKDDTYNGVMVDAHDTHGILEKDDDKSLSVLHFQKRSVSFILSKNTNNNKLYQDINTLLQKYIYNRGIYKLCRENIPNMADELCII